MARTYTTAQGETWDEIAYKIYGREGYADVLMAGNYPFLDILVFSAGTVLDIPDLPEYDDEELPPWRLGAEMDGDEDPYDDYSDEEEMEGDG